MSTTFALVSLIILLALIFDYTNGFHDAANSIATVVSTRVLSPGKAVALAAFFNFVAVFFVGTHVASTIGTGLIDIGRISEWVILAGLIGAITWNLITWYLGLPTSSSHALVGGYAGAAVAKSGFSVLLWNTWPKGWPGTLSFIVLSPTIGLVLGTSLMVLVAWIFRRAAPSRVDKLFRVLQVVSASLYSLSHGTNDAQKTMGIMLAALITGGVVAQGTAEPPYWVIFSAYTAIALGTLSGGWRIVKTMGTKITKLRPVGGFCAETGGAIAILFASSYGIPVSTTHTITGAIVGVGSTKRLSSVRWGVAGRIVWAWVLTIPAAASISALTYFMLSFLY
ncbi:MAG: inorganic phosphate transporter [Acidobacteria bacterium]|nr:inorganic phosphate transporter [Acidobacteriota bacterium]MCW5971033.1 inorganic phosphate transporter [Blastocatellales bacterium]